MSKSETHLGHPWSAAGRGRQGMLCASTVPVYHDHHLSLFTEINCNLGNPNFLAHELPLRRYFALEVFCEIGNIPFSDCRKCYFVLFFSFYPYAIRSSGL